MKHLIPVLLTLAIPAGAQVVSFGFKGGVPILDAVPQNRFSSSDRLTTGRWTVGPSVEFRLPHGFAFEVNALFRGFRIQGVTQTSSGPDFTPVAYSQKREVKAWDFTFLLKYRFLQRPVRPFVSAGVSITHQTEDFTINELPPLFGGSASGAPPTLLPNARFGDSLNRRGLVAGGGVEIPWKRLKFAPEFRYTRLQNLATNQASILLGVTF